MNKSFNRDIVECKDGMSDFQILDTSVLIET